MFKKIILLLSIIVLLIGLITAGVATYIVMSCPTTSLADVYKDVGQRSVLYDSEGDPIESIYFPDGNRDIITYEEMPQTAIDAVVAIEDRTFWEHHGFNFIRMIGAVKESILGGGQISGTSTITQQLARNIYLADIKSERTWTRKAKEAYYTVMLEKSLTKKQIMEAYLNTVYFGYGSYGIEMAARNYFGKSAKDLSLRESAALMALPQAPDAYALVVCDYDGGETSLPVIKEKNGVKYLYNGDLSKERRDTVFSRMQEDGYISSEEMQDGITADYMGLLHVNTSDGSSYADYFADYAVKSLAEEFADAYDLSMEDATAFVYTGGLEIYTTMDKDIQKILYDEINEDENYTSLSYYRRDGDGNLITAGGTILARPYDSLFDDGDLVLRSDEYSITSDGTIKISEDSRLHLYDVETASGKGVSVELPHMYDDDSGTLYLISGGNVNIPAECCSKDGDGNCVISASFIQEHQDFFREGGGELHISKDNCSLNEKSRQPQAAAAIMKNGTGEVLAIVGGRGGKGKMLYNRALSPRQPGSSIKPIAVYAPALQYSFDKAENDERPSLDTSKGDRWGDYITAGSVINDAPMKINGRVWPKNASGRFAGRTTLRTCVQNSVNVAAVKVYRQIGSQYSIKKLKENGITSLDEEGDVSDLNPAALALGGMTNGISPLEMTAAYATFPGKGVYTKPQLYTKVCDSNGQIILKTEPQTKRVFDSGVAWIMSDILRGVVKYGTGRNAGLSSQPVAGKTGTTSDKYDIWFAGFTPQYTMALWEGSDINIEMNSDSSAAASFWSHIMGRVCEGTTYESEFYAKPDNVIRYGGEYYVRGTESGAHAYRAEKKTTEKKKESETARENDSGSSGESQSEAHASTDYRDDDDFIGFFD